MGLQAWQQLTGVNFIFYYGTQFFKNSGLANPFLITVATNVVNVGMTIPGMWLVDRAGRRRMLLLGALGMGVCQFLIAIIGVTISVDNGPGQKALVALVCLYIVSLSILSEVSRLHVINRLGSQWHGVPLRGLSLERSSRSMSALSAWVYRLRPTGSGIGGSDTPHLIWLIQEKETRISDRKYSSSGEASALAVSCSHTSSSQRHVCFYLLRVSL
jgi:MFS family permease